MQRVRTDVDLCAEQIRQHFYAQKRQQLGHGYSPHERFRKPEFWVKAAAACIEVEADPYSFVRAAFIHCKVPGGPFPHTMGGGAARGWYRTYQRQCGKGEDGEDVFAAEVNSAIFNVAQMIMEHPSEGREKLIYAMAEYHEWPAHARLLLFPSLDIMWMGFGSAGRHELAGNPHLVKTLLELGYNAEVIERIQQWQQ